MFHVIGSKYSEMLEWRHFGVILDQGADDDPPERRARALEGTPALS